MINPYEVSNEEEIRMEWVHKSAIERDGFMAKKVARPLVCWSYDSFMSLSGVVGMRSFEPWR